MGQDLCKFLAIPIKYEQHMIGAQKVNDKTAECSLSLTLPARKSKGETDGMDFDTSAVAKGEKEAVQLTSIKMVKELVLKGWVEPKNHADNAVEELNLKKMKERFKNDIQPSNVETYNIYGGHTESSAPGRLSH